MGSTALGSVSVVTLFFDISSVFVVQVSCVGDMLSLFVLAGVNVGSGEVAVVLHHLLYGEFTCMVQCTKNFANPRELLRHGSHQW